MRDIYLISHFIGLALGVGSNFFLLAMRLSTKSLSIEEQNKLMEKVRPATKLGSIGLLLIIISGLALLLPQWSNGLILKKDGLFHTKLTLVFILVLLFGFLQILQKRVLSSGTIKTHNKLRSITLMMALLNTAIIIIAVYIFH